MSNAPFSERDEMLQFSEVEQKRIRTHLEELLANRLFAGSRRRQAFLRYVVEEALAGRGAGIKETNIAIDVFGRGRDFDAQGASVVRVTGGDVRKRLIETYASGISQEIRIELPIGSYQPLFHFAKQPEIDLEPAPAPVIETSGAAPNRRTWILSAGGVSIVIAAMFFYSLGTAQSQSHSPIDLVWQPFLNPNRPVLISMVSPTLLKLNPFHKDKWLPIEHFKEIPTSELLTLDNSYVGTGGALGAARFAEQLAVRKQRFDLKFGSDVTFADLKNSPTILIGISKLSQDLTRSVRFQMKVNEDLIMVADTKQENRTWQLPTKPETYPRPDGYSLITRLLHSDSGQPVLIVEGMDARNTQAAVEFLTSNDLFRQFSQSASADWSGKNFQVVLYNSVYGNSAGSQKVMASYIW